MEEYKTGYATLRPGGTPLTRQLLSMGGELKKKRVLDLGCGRGETALLLAQEYSCTVTGTDLSRSMIDACRQNCPGADFYIADAGALPFADGTFDAVVSECSFSVFQEPEKALQEANRVLVSGGWLLISDLWQQGGLSCGTGMVRSLYTREEWERMIGEAGFGLTDFIDARDALTEMYVQMILDLGIARAQQEMGLCLGREEMKQVSYMMLAARKA